MGRLFKATYRDRKGRSRESSKWYAEFRDHNETIRRVPTFTSKAAAGEFARNVEKLVGFHRASGGQMDPNLGPWLETLSTAIKTKLVEIGLLDGHRPKHAITLHVRSRDVHRRTGPTGRLSGSRPRDVPTTAERMKHGDHLQETG